MKSAVCDNESVCVSLCVCVCVLESHYRDAVETLDGERERWEHELTQYAKVCIWLCFTLTFTKLVVKMLRYSGKRCTLIRAVKKNNEQLID